MRRFVLLLPLLALAAPLLAASAEAGREKAGALPSPPVRILAFAAVRGETAPCS